MARYLAQKTTSLQWRSQTKLLRGAKSLTLGEQEYFLGHCSSKHKMTGYAKNIWEV